MTTDQSEARKRINFHGKQVLYGRYIVIAELLEGEWPSDTDLLCLADGSERPLHLGGDVQPTADPRYKLVKVYTS